MKEKLNVVRIANSLAITTGIIYLVCILAVLISPGLTANIGSYLLIV